MKTKELFCLSILISSFVNGRTASSLMDISASPVQESGSTRQDSSTRTASTFALNVTSAGHSPISSLSLLPSSSQIFASAEVTLELSLKGRILFFSTTSSSINQYQSSDMTSVKRGYSSFNSNTGGSKDNSNFTEINSTGSYPSPTSTNIFATPTETYLFEYTSSLDINSTYARLSSTTLGTNVSKTTDPSVSDLVHETLSSSISYHNVSETLFQDLGIYEASAIISESLELQMSKVQTINPSTIDLLADSQNLSFLSFTRPLDTMIESISSVRNQTHSNTKISSTFTTSATLTGAYYFTDSVYSLANLSFSSLSVAVSKPSTTSSLFRSSLDSAHDVIVSTRVPTLQSDAFFTSSGAADVSSGLDQIHTSDMDIAVSTTALKSSSQKSSNLAFQSSKTETIFENNSLGTKITPTSAHSMQHYSTNFPTLVSSESVDPETKSPVSVISSSISGKTVTENTQIYSTTSTLSTMAFSSDNPVTSNNQTTTENSNVSSNKEGIDIYRVLITFDGNCEILSEDDILTMEFVTASLDIIKSTSRLQSKHLFAEKIFCDPMRMYLRIELNNDTDSTNISQIADAIKSKIASANFFVPIIEDMRVLNFTATQFQLLDEISRDDDDPEVAKTRLGVVDIVIISIAGFLFAVLVLMIIIVLCRECYVRKRTTIFHLNDVPHVNLKLSDFTLTRIPRPKMFYRENSLRKPGPVPVSKLRAEQKRHSSDKIHVNRDHIRVRMSKHEDGLIVGITCSNPPSPRNDSSSRSSSPSSGDQSKKSLLKGGNQEISDGVTNPNFSAEEEPNGNTKHVIQEDENEQLL